MKYKLLIFLSSFYQVLAQNTDSIIYFNKSIPKNSVTLSTWGESGYFGVGYERSLTVRKYYRLAFSLKTGNAGHNGFTIPLGIAQEFLAGKNKILSTVYLGSNISPTSKRYSMKDVRELEENPKPLKSPIVFFYTPYGAMSLGYKRYFSSKHALSFYVVGGIAPQFVLISATKAKLTTQLVGWGGVTYYYQF